VGVARGVLDKVVAGVAVALDGLLDDTGVLVDGGPDDAGRVAAEPAEHALTPAVSSAHAAMPSPILTIPGWHAGCPAAWRAAPIRCR
jgi:hypothetical protein